MSQTEGAKQRQYTFADFAVFVVGTAFALNMLRAGIAFWIPAAAIFGGSLGYLVGRIFGRTDRAATIGAILGSSLAAIVLVLVVCACGPQSGLYRPINASRP